ncbi:MAG: hypothetical protein QM499_04475 [Flavobacteriaceae bacterium]
MNSDSSSITISSKFILYLIIIFTGIIISLFIFNNINEKRKKKKFYELIENTKKSSHINNLLELTKDFNNLDSLNVNNIKRELTELNYEIDILYSCKLIIPTKNKYYTIQSYRDSKLELKKNLLEKEKKSIEFLNNNLIENMYDLSRNDQPIWSTIKIGNNYLIIRRYLYN